VIRLVKLKGLQHLSRVLAQPANPQRWSRSTIHRGLKKLAALVACDAIFPATTSASSYEASSHLNRSKPSSEPPALRNPATEE